MPSMKAGRVTRSAIVLRVVAVDAGDRMLHQLDRLGIGHRVHLLEAFDEVAVAGLLVGEIDRGVAIHAGAGLLHHHLALGEGLILEHVGVAAVLAEVGGEGIALPHRLEADVVFDFRVRDDRARIGRRSAYAASASLPPYLVRSMSTVLR